MKKSIWSAVCGRESKDTKEENRKMLTISIDLITEYEMEYSHKGKHTMDKKRICFWEIKKMQVSRILRKKKKEAIIRLNGWHEK